MPTLLPLSDRKGDFSKVFLEMGIPMKKWTRQVYVMVEFEEAPEHPLGNSGVYKYKSSFLAAPPHFWLISLYLEAWHMWR